MIDEGAGGLCIILQGGWYRGTGGCLLVLTVYFAHVAVL